jgi:hypothetical protein
MLELGLVQQRFSQAFSQSVGPSGDLLTPRIDSPKNRGVRQLH